MYDGSPKKPSLSHHFSVNFMPSHCRSALLTLSFSVVVSNSSLRENCQFLQRELTVPTEGTVGYPYWRMQARFMSLRIL